MQSRDVCCATHIILACDVSDMRVPVLFCYIQAKFGCWSGLQLWVNVVSNTVVSSAAAAIDIAFQGLLHVQFLIACSMQKWRVSASDQELEV